MIESSNQIWYIFSITFWYIFRLPWVFCEWTDRRVAMVSEFICMIIYLLLMHLFNSDSHDKRIQRKQILRTNMILNFLKLTMDPLDLIIYILYVACKFKLLLLWNKLSIILLFWFLEINIRRANVSYLLKEVS